MLLVTNLDNGRKARCRVNDRGPARWTKRALDVSRHVAEKLGMIHRGTARIRFQIVGHSHKR